MRRGNSLFFSVIKETQKVLDWFQISFCRAGYFDKTSYVPSNTKDYCVRPSLRTPISCWPMHFQFAVHVSSRMENDSSTTHWRIAGNITNMIATALSQKNYQKSFEHLEPQRREYQAIKIRMVPGKMSPVAVAKASADRNRQSWILLGKERYGWGDYDSTSPW